MQRMQDAIFAVFGGILRDLFSQCKSDDFNQKKSEKIEEIWAFFRGKKSTNFDKFWAIFKENSADFGVKKRVKSFFW